MFCSTIPTLFTLLSSCSYIVSDQVWCLKSVANILVVCTSEDFTKNILKSWVSNMYYSVKDLASLFYSLGIHISESPIEAPTAKRFIVLLSHTKMLLPSPSREKFIDAIFEMWTSNFQDPMGKYKSSLTTRRQVDAFHSSKLFKYKNQL